VVVSVLSAEAILLVLVQPQANVGQLLFELRRNREHMAALV
jgi:predicted regulator of Ras-like GTPase activity (Roadblock/LC7/MglB family)